ncbi:Alpha/Beta hydrolase protein [Suillus subluteus]|nr:Alpha/Beta hydrolase protein [Suillus subluteus]
MFLRTFVRVGIALLAGVRAVSADLNTTEAGLIDVQSKVNASGICYVKNSGICETTPNVTQIIDVGTKMSMMQTDFKYKNRPCLANADRNSTTLNPYSWNNLSNSMYDLHRPANRDRIIGTSTVNSTDAAAPYSFIFAAESYGGHYGPSFVTYFEEQNALIASGATDFVPVFDIAWLNFAAYAPGYGQLQLDEVLKNMSDALCGSNGCMALEKACYAAGNSTSSNKICQDAEDYCIDNLYYPAVEGYDQNDLRQNSSALFPPEYYVDYLREKHVMKKIGAEVKYEECANALMEQFAKTGDDARTWLPQLSTLANSGMRILIWVHASVLAMEWYVNETLHNTPFINMTINGTPVAAVQNVDNFSFARVYAAGHLVPAFQPQATLEIFSQVIRKEQLHSV